jgi:hypothetical protein
LKTALLQQQQQQQPPPPPPPHISPFNPLKQFAFSLCKQEFTPGQSGNTSRMNFTNISRKRLDSNSAHSANIPLHISIHSDETGDDSMHHEQVERCPATRRAHVFQRRTSRF